MIKIVHIITGLVTGGAEMMLYKLLSRTDRARFDPVVISLSDRGTLGDRIEALGIPVIDIGMARGRTSLADIRRLIAISRKLKPDIVQGWMYHGNIAAQLAALFIPKRTTVLWNIRQSLYSLSYEKRTTAAVIKLGSYLSRFPAAIIYNSKASAVQHEAIGYREDAHVYLPNGFDTDLFVPSEQARMSVRSELGMSEDDLVIGLIGRYHPMKDHAGFLKAAALLLNRRPNVLFVLIGTAVDHNNDHLRDVINNLKISKHVFLLGERKDVPRLTAGLDIAVSSSSYGEGFPNVIGEAMSCSVPCVVTDVGDSALIVDNAGIVVPPCDPSALANGCLKLIERGKEERLEIGRRGRQRIVNHYSLDAVVKCYENLYVQALKGENHAGRI